MMARTSPPDTPDRPVSVETFLSRVDCALLGSQRARGKASWTGDEYQRELVSRIGKAVLDLRSAPRTAVTQAGLQSLAHALDCELAAILRPRKRGLEVSHVYAPELTLVDRLTKRRFSREGLLAEVLRLGDYRSVNDESNMDRQLADYGIKSVMAVPYMGAEGEPAILLVGNRRPYAKHEARFLSYDGELCRLYAEHLFGKDGALEAETDEDYRARLTATADHNVAHYDSLWRNDGRKESE